MPTYKCNYFFKFSDFGWSETLYCDDINAAAAMVRAKNLIVPRVQMLGGGSTGANPRLAEVRISNIQIQRDSLIYQVPPLDGVAPNPVGTTDNPNLCLLLRLDSGDLYRRQLYLRGQPDLLISNGAYQADAFWGSRFIGWRTIVSLFNFGILALDRNAVLGIMGISYGVGGVVTIDTGVPHGLSTQDQVRIISAPGTTGVRGVWFIQSVDATHFILLGAAGSGVYTGGGKYTKRTYSLKIIDSIQIMRAGRRATGRPFDSPVGRRRRRITA